MSEPARLRTRINGAPVVVPCPDERILLDLLREDLNLTGTKRGCDLGTCGCCTVIVDGRAMLSCLMLARSVEGREVTTIEGVAPAGGMTRLQKGFVATGATQCGFCTPGFIMTGEALFRANPHPTREEIVTAISGNLCRCTGYTKIIASFEAAAREE
jgi:aerobic-type carbon monoxide dehydrogenase small subunit (CoxS/CutS family)